jgi:class 3 adenylate cyclase
MSLARRVRRQIAVTNLAGNLLGAVITFFYFRFVDTAAALGSGRLTAAEIAYFVVAFAIIGAIGWLVSLPWLRPLMRAIPAAPMAPAERALLRQRALLLPWALAGLTFVAWVLAGLVWGVAWPGLAGVLRPGVALRLMFGITCVAGTVTTLFVFFATEHQWRAVLPAFFPEGDLAGVAGTPRLPVRVRLLLIFLVASVIPQALLGILATTRAAALADADRAAAAGLVEALRGLILFLVAVGSAAAAGLAFFVSHSVAAPLGRLRQAMAEVERGRLDVRAPVVSDDEIGAVTEGFNRMVRGLREREAMRESFGKYVTPEIRDEILAGRLSLEGQVQAVTILFADLRDFTPWVERSDPRAVVRDLNAYFTEMEGAIRRHRGLVLQYIGDEIEAVFGAPLPDPVHAEQAARAALEMRARLAAWNAARAGGGQVPLGHGIGIHTGTVLAASIGSADRLSYALVGDAVNLASRIQGLTREAGTDILLSAETRRRLGGEFAIEALPAMRVKGRSEEVEVYRLVAG